MSSAPAAAGGPSRWAVVLLALVTVSGCQWNSWIPGGGKAKSSKSGEAPVPLYPGRPRQAELDCPAGNCQMRYRIHVPATGELHLELVPAMPDERVGVRVVLEDSVGQVIGQQRAAGEGSVELRSPVTEGPYFVLVQAIGGRVGYELTATVVGSFGPAPAAPVPQPRPPSADRVGDKVETRGSDSAYNPGVDFSRYQRFAFSERPEERLEGEPGSSAGNPFLEAEIQRAIRSELLDRGFLPAPEDEADFLVSTHVGSRSKTWYSLGSVRYSDDYDTWFSQWSMRGAVIRMHSFRDGTLVIDFVDVRKKELSWHGWTTRPIPPAVDAKALIRQLVAEVLDQFPPN